jgi:hypothetical protein
VHLASWQRDQQSGWLQWCAPVPLVLAAAAVEEDRDRDREMELLEGEVAMEGMPATPPPLTYGQIFHGELSKISLTLSLCLSLFLSLSLSLSLSPSLSCRVP